MAQYIVERILPNFTADQLKAAARLAKETTAEMTAEGTPIRYMRSFFVPGEDKCFCLFDGPSAAVVQEANDRAQLPYVRISDGIHVESSDLP